MKSFTDLFIKRPVLALVVSFVILIAGLQAMDKKFKLFYVIS